MSTNLYAEAALAGVLGFKPHPNGHDQASASPLGTLWADDIAFSLDKGGLVEGLLGRSGMTVLYGESGTGKTFVTIDLACHIAAGRPWRGRAVEQGVVIYVAAEAPESVKRRIWAWKHHHRVERLPVLIVDSSVDLLNGSTEALVELVQQVRREHGRVAMVVIDTLARAMTGNENSPDDMGKFVAACGRIREAGEANVLVVHHSGKDAARGARGHSCLRAATDAEIEITPGLIRVTKSRDGESGHNYGFRLAKFELGTNAKGHVVTTCVVAEAEPPAKGEPSARLNAAQQNALSHLSTALADHGEAAPPAPDIPLKALVVRFERWREVARRYSPPDDRPEWRQRFEFKRTAEQLRAKGLIRLAGGYCWLPSQTSHTSQHPLKEDI